MLARYAFQLTDNDPQPQNIVFPFHKNHKSQCFYNVIYPFSRCKSFLCFFQSRITCCFLFLSFRLKTNLHYHIPKEKYNNHYVKRCPIQIPYSKHYVQSFVYKYYYLLQSELGSKSQHFQHWNYRFHYQFKICTKYNININFKNFLSHPM